MDFPNTFIINVIFLYIFMYFIYINTFNIIIPRLFYTYSCTMHTNGYHLDFYGLYQCTYWYYTVMHARNADMETLYVWSSKNYIQIICLFIYICSFKRHKDGIEDPSPPHEPTAYTQWRTATRPYYVCTWGHLMHDVLIIDCVGYTARRHFPSDFSTYSLRDVVLVSPSCPDVERQGEGWRWNK